METSRPEIRISFSQFTISDRAGAVVPEASTRRLCSSLPSTGGSQGNTARAARASSQGGKEDLGRGQVTAWQLEISETLSYKL